MQFKFRKLSRKGLVAVVAILLTVLLGAQHVGQGQHRATDSPDVLAMLNGNNESQRNNNAHKKPQPTVDPPARYTPLHTVSLLTALPAVHKSGALSQDETWQAGTVFVIDGTVTVPDGKTLTVAAGAIVKSHYTGANIQVDTGGSLRIEGTEGDPAVFTSYSDDSYGGDTNSNGNEIPDNTKYDYGTFIRVAGGAIDTDFAVFKHLRQLVNVESSSSVAIQDSTFSASQIALNVADTQNPVVKRNAFNLIQNTYGTGMTFSNIADITQVSFAGSDQNSVQGTKLESTVSFYDVAVPEDTSWTIGSDAGAIIRAAQMMQVRGQLNILPHTTLLLGQPLYGSTYGIKSYGQVNIGAGTIIKAINTRGIQADEGGEVAINGTLNDKVIFTSYYDDNHGGDTNANGTDNQPSRGQYASALTVGPASGITAQNVEIFYANTALVSDSNGQNEGGVMEVAGATIQDVASAAWLEQGTINISDAIISDATNGIDLYQGKVGFRGTMQSITSKAISACNWGGDCVVDAAFTDWGEAGGPNASSLKVCGAAQVNPWRYNGVLGNDSTVFIPNCDGSPTPGQKLDTSISHFQERISSRQIDCSGGWQPACQAIGNAYACLAGAVNVAASTSPIPLPEIQPDGTGIAGYGSAVGSAAGEYLVTNSLEQITHSQIASRLMPLVGVFMASYSAYSTCAP